MGNPEDLLAVGPPPLTQYAADCALEIIDFMAAVVRGVDLIDVTETMREIWRNYLAAHYPSLGMPDRFWFANAPAELSQLMTGWPQMPLVAQESWRTYWSASLPGILQFIQPVLQAAEQQQAWAHVQHPAFAPSYQPVERLNQIQDQAANLSAFSTRMTSLTLNQMRAMSGR